MKKKKTKPQEKKWIVVRLLSGLQSYTGVQNPQNIRETAYMIIPSVQFKLCMWLQVGSHVHDTVKQVYLRNHMNFDSERVKMS